MEFKREKKLQQLIDSKKNGLVKVITGVRRCGKSYLLDPIFKRYLLEEGVKEDHIITFAFDFDEDLDKLIPFFPEEPVKIQISKTEYVINSRKFRAYINSLISDQEDYYLLFDEVQLLENFVGTLNGYLKHPNYDVYVTGSNSKFLASDIETQFRGRGDPIRMQPLTYKEIYNGVGGDKAELLENYLRYGGLPLCVLSENDEKKESYLKTTYQTTYRKDLLERHKIKNIKEFEELVKVVASVIGSPINVERIKNTFNSKEHSKIAPKTISRFLDYLSDSFLTSSCEKYDIKGRKYIGATSKIYFTDVGIRNAILNFRQSEKTHLMENVIYEELLYRGFNVDVGSVEIYAKCGNKKDNKSYSKKKLEVDFVCNKGSEKIYIQSAFNIEEESKKEQEEKSLDNIPDSFKKIIITYGQLKPYYNEKGYLIMGLIDFLLDDKYII